MSHPYLSILAKPRRTLAVIGTAGRRDDEAKLSAHHWLKMIAAVREVAHIESVTTLVSGGAAWADHVAVHLSGDFPTKLFIPASPKDCETARYYHAKFSRVIGRDSFIEVLDFPHKEFRGSFKERNTHVADAADVFIAMTFGAGPKVKDGGTADTVKKMLQRGVRGYHFDLNTLELHSIP